MEIQQASVECLIYLAKRNAHDWAKTLKLGKSLSYDPPHNRGLIIKFVPHRLARII